MQSSGAIARGTGTRDPLSPFARTLGLVAMVFVGCLTVSAEPFFVARRTVEIPERGTFSETVLVTTNTEFSFLPPAGWNMTADTNENKVTWLWQDFSSIITVKIVPGPPAHTPQIRPAEQRQEALRRFSGAKITHEFVCYTSGHQGPAFDLENSVNGGFVRTTRLAWVPFAGGVVEFDLTCPAEFFVRHQRDFAELLNSFRIATRDTKKSVASLH